MLSIPPTVSIFLYTQPTDMRKGFDGLSGMVRSEFAADALDGSLFLFINRRRDRLKILHFDGSGYWLYYKLLEAGTAASGLTKVLSLGSLPLADRLLTEALLADSGTST